MVNLKSSIQLHIDIIDEKLLKVDTQVSET